MLNTKQKKFIGIQLIGIISIIVWVLPIMTVALSAEEQKKLNDIQSQLKNKKTNYQALQDKITLYRENLKAKQEQKTTLNNQIEVFNQDINITKTEIEKTSNEVETLELEIEQLGIEINDAQTNIDDKKGQISTLIRDLYDYDQKTYLEIALSHNTLSEFSTEVEYTENVNNKFNEALQELQEYKKALQQDKKDVTAKQEQEQEKQEELAVRKKNLEGEVQYKSDLLVEVGDDEEKFQSLIKEIQSEQSSINSELSSLEKKAREYLVTATPQPGGTPNPDGTTNPGTPIDMTEFNPDWPVRGIITTRFHDPNYIFRSYFEHDAIDIAAPQGTALKAADDGVVAVVKFDGSPNYAYVMIVHPNNFSTIYGHVSSVYVQPEQQVHKGETIAAIGGAPGTTGAGNFSTGSHVHFGVRLNNIPVDPLMYLP